MSAIRDLLRRADPGSLRPRLPKLGWVDWTGLVLLGGAAFFVLLWRADYLTDWAPNAATELASIAITIVLVDRIVQRERRRRWLPRREAAYSEMHFAASHFIGDLRRDYEAVVGTTERDWGHDGLKSMDRWLQQFREEQDGPAAPGRKDDVFHAAMELSETFSEIARRDSDILEPELVSEIHHFSHSAKVLKVAFNGYVGLLKDGKIEESRIAERNLLETTLLVAQRMLSAYDVLAQGFPVEAYAGGEAIDDGRIPEGVPALRRVERAHRIGEHRGLRYYPDPERDVARRARR